MVLGRRRRGHGVAAGPRTLLPLGLGLAACLLAGSTAFAEAPQKTVRVGVYDNPPLVSLDERGEGVGIYPDILKDIAAKEGWRLEWVPGTFDEGLSRLDTREIDVMTAIAYTAKRAERFYFSSVTVLANWGQVYVPAGSTLESVLDLEGKRVAVVKGDVYYEAFRSDAAQFGVRIRFDEVDEYADILDHVDQREADAGIVSRVYGLTHEEGHRVRRTPIVLSPIELRFAFPKNSRRSLELAESLDRRLRVLKDRPDSAYHRALDRWLLGSRGAGIAGWLWWAVGVGAALMVSAFVVSAVLRVQVRSRTAELAAKNAQLEEEIRERVRVEGALRDSETRFRTMFEQAIDGILLADMDTKKFRMANPAIVRMLGYSTEELLRVGVEDIHPAEDLPRVIAAFEAQARGELTVARDLPVVRKDGSVFFADIASSPLVLEGHPYLLGMFRDCTERRAVEQLKSDLLATVSHELRSPIAVILGNLDLVERAGVNRPEVAGRALAKARKRTAEMQQLVEQLLDVSAIEAGRPVLRKRPTDVVALVRKCVDAVQPPATHPVVIDSEDPLPRVECDPDRLAHAVRNILSNAVKFSPAGGEIRVDVRRHADRFRLGVTDLGVGIEPKDLGAIFHRFSQADMSGTRPFGGFGLGLFIAHTVVQAHGGSITVESTPGRGSTFTIEIPVGG